MFVWRWKAWMFVRVWISWWLPYYIFQNQMVLVGRGMRCSKCESMNTRIIGEQTINFRTKYHERINQIKLIEALIFTPVFTDLNIFNLINKNRSIHSRINTIRLVDQGLTIQLNQKYFLNQKLIIFFACHSFYWDRNKLIASHMFQRKLHWIESADVPKRVYS